MPFDLQPTLRGRLLVLRPLQADDFEDSYEAASDPLIWQQHPESTRFQRDVFRKFFDSGIASKGAFAVVDLESGRIIGSSRYYEYDPHRREIVIGYTFLKREFWGGAYNAEMKSLMLDHAFRVVDRVMFHVDEGNIRSQKAMTKIGARLYGTNDTSLVFVIERGR